MQQLEKKLREGTDPPVRGKWNTVNNPHEERYQSKLQDIQKERKAAIEVSFFQKLTFVSCAMKMKPTRNHIGIKDSNGPIKWPVEQWFINWGKDTRDSYLSGGCQVVLTPPMPE